MRTLLLIHDAPSARADLEAAMGPARGRWTIDAVNTTLDAVERLTTGHYDLVVADARPGGIGGPSLLVEAAAWQPKAVRVLLADNAGRALMIQAEGGAHQHWARPLDVAATCDRIERTLALGELLADGRLAAVVSRMRAVPSVPTVYLAMMAELRQDDPSALRVGELVAKDAGMSAKLLQLVNSPMFALQAPLSDPARAVQFLGLDTVRALVLSLHIFQQFDERALRRFRLNRAWRHSLSTAHCARIVARLQDRPPLEESLTTTAAVLHDIGKLVLASSLPDEYAAALRWSDERGACSVEAEREVIGATHAEVGAYLLGMWGIPDELVEVVAWHHQPSEFSSPEFGPVGLVHVADAIEHEVHPEDAIGPPVPIDSAYMERFGAAWQYAAWKAAYSDAGGEGHGRGLAARL